MESRKFRFHVIGLPHTKTNFDYTACAYTQKALKFCKMMHDRGHYVMHYGTEGSDPICDENITVLSDAIYQKVYGAHDFHSKWFTYDTNDEAYQTFYDNCTREILAHAQPYDIILPFWNGCREICERIQAQRKDLIIAEPGIGYGYGTYAPYKVFESYAIYHAYCGVESVASCKQNYYEVVIPNYFDLNDFSYNGDKETRLKGKLREDGTREDPYFLFVGRVYDGKGVHIAMEVSQHLGVKLKIAGQLASPYDNPDWQWPANVEFVGYVGKEERCELMKNAIASFVATQYLGPFEGVQAENLLCGTPTITTDWGVFAENNIHGVTGYRCRTYNDFVDAAKKCMAGEIKYIDCRKKGEEFSLENVAPMYEKFFGDVTNLFTGNGWYELSEENKQNDHRANYIRK